MPTVRDDPEASAWAEQLRDGTLQGLAAVRTLLSAGLRNESPQVLERAAAEALRQVDVEIAGLRELLGDEGGAARLPLPARPAQVSTSPRLSA